MRAQLHNQISAGFDRVCHRNSLRQAFAMAVEYWGVSALLNQAPQVHLSTVVCHGIGSGTIMRGSRMCLKGLCFKWPTLQGPPRLPRPRRRPRRRWRLADGLAARLPQTPVAQAGLIEGGREVRGAFERPAGASFQLEVLGVSGSDSPAVRVVNSESVQLRGTMHNDASSPHIRQGGMDDRPGWRSAWPSTKQMGCFDK